MIGKRLLLCCGLIGIFAGSIIGYRVGATEEEVSPPQPQDLSRSPSFPFPAILRAVNGIDLTPESSGLIKTIDFVSGRYVKKNEVLITLIADAERARLNSLKALAKLAQITYTRTKDQLAIHGVSKATLDQALADLKSKKEDVVEQEAVVARKIIRAPFEGLLGVSAVSLGQYLEPGDKIVTLQSLDPIYVDFYLPQSLFTQVSISQPIYFKTNAYPEIEFEGKITSINAKFNPATQKVQVEALLENSARQLFPGMSGSVAIEKSSPSPLP